MTARGMSEKSKARVEELDFLLKHDRNVPSILARLGLSPGAADILCRRAGRNDLAALVRFYGPGRADRPEHGDPYGDTAQSFYLRTDGDPLAGFERAFAYRNVARTGWRSDYDVDV